MVTNPETGRSHQNGREVLTTVAVTFMESGVTKMIKWLGALVVILLIISSHDSLPADELYPF